MIIYRAVPCVSKMERLLCNQLVPPLVQLFITGISILNYFKIKAKVNHPVEPCMELPDPKGPLSASVPSSTNIAVNKKLKFNNGEVCQYK